INDKSKELEFQGVYRLTPDGKLTLLTKEIKFPNGLAFSPDEKTLYVGQSDSSKPVVYAFDVQADGTVNRMRDFFDAKSLLSTGPGALDGMKVDKQGNLFATGPNGVLVISPDGKHLGTLVTGEKTGNCAWGEDGSTLFIMADKH